MEDLFGEIVFSIFGRIYLWIRYRNKRKVQEVKEKEYGNEYSNVGRVMIFKIILIALIVSIFGLLLIPVFRTIIK